MQMMPNFWILIYLINSITLMIMFINNFYMMNMKKL